MEFRKKAFSKHRACWESVWGSDIERCGDFEDATTLSSMQFTHYDPFTIPKHVGSTLQIYSIRIKQLSDDLNWPLKVCGVVAARDTLDHKRNILFSRSCCNYQLVTEKNPYLTLTGPSRAIFAVDPVDFELELKISEGVELISLHKVVYNPKESTTLFFRSPKCLVEFSIGQFCTPVQATIVGVRVAKGSWPFKHGCRVVCSNVNGIHMHKEIVLLDYYGKVMSVGTDGYLHMSRKVVSVDIGQLRVAIQAYSESGCPAQQGHVDFGPKMCQTSKSELSFGNAELEIVVAWSLVGKKNLGILFPPPTLVDWS